MVPSPIAPKSLKPEELQKIQASVLTYIGTKDAEVGDADKAKKLAENIPNSIIKVFESGHLIGAELAGQINQEILEFLSIEDNKFTIRRGVNASHWLSQSDKRGDERKYYMTEKDFEYILKSY